LLPAACFFLLASVFALFLYSRPFFFCCHQADHWMEGAVYGMYVQEQEGAPFKTK
jgi:hypothetical protein